MKPEDQLADIWDSLQWERKFRHQWPPEYNGFLKVFKAINGQTDVEAARKWFSRHKEETNKVYRAAFLTTDSTGVVLIVTEDEWSD